MLERPELLVLLRKLAKNLTPAPPSAAASRSSAASSAAPPPTPPRSITERIGVGFDLATLLDEDDLVRAPPRGSRQSTRANAAAERALSCIVLFVAPAPAAQDDAPPPPPVSIGQRLESDFDLASLVPAGGMQARHA